VQVGNEIKSDVNQSLALGRFVIARRAPTTCLSFYMRGFMWGL
jgi:hypothetical protein